MHPTLCLNSRIEQLKRVEGFGYSVAFFLLGDEKLAADATKAALLKISEQTAFFEECLQVQQNKFKKAVISEALNVKIGLLSR